MAVLSRGTGMNARKDYYSVLGVSPSADEVALGAAYRTLLKKYHPDVFSGPREKAEARTREIVEAYETLRDSAKRRAYDVARTDLRPGNVGNRSRERANVSDGISSGGISRGKANTSTNWARNDPRPRGQMPLWALVIVATLGFLLAVRLLYYGL
jgi:curved DNA-binding protein CbpA